MRWVTLFCYALFGIMIFMSVVSAYHLRDYNRVYYVQEDRGFIDVGASGIIVSYDAPFMMSAPRVRSFDDVYYPRYMQHRKSGKVYYMSSQIDYSRPTSYPALYPPWYCPPHVISC